VSHIWELEQNHTIFNNCTVLYTTETDPCLEQWIEDDHRNLYGLGGPLWFQMTKSSPSLPEPDVLIYWLPGWFSGFHHGFGDALAAAHNVITGVALRGHASSCGVVQLTGSHPQDPLHIEKRHFEAPGGKEDIAALLEGFKVAQSHMGHPNISSQVEAQIFPTQALNTDEDIENHILETVFGASAAYPYVFLKINMAPTGHHACCTASMGPDDGEFSFSSLY
jgi:choline dehydrogenase